MQVSEYHLWLTMYCLYCGQRIKPRLRSWSCEQYRKTHFFLTEYASISNTPVVICIWLESNSVASTHKAKDSICRKCNQKGYYGVKCYSKSVGRVSTEDTAFLGLVHANQDNSWVVILSLGGMPVPFKLDMGAEVTVISGNTYGKLGNPALQEPSRILYGPARRALNEEDSSQQRSVIKGSQPSKQFRCTRPQDRSVGTTGY